MKEISCAMYIVLNNLHILMEKFPAFIYTSEICACYATRLSHIHIIIAVPLLKLV